MTSHSKVKIYSPFEEKLNILSHGLGFVLAIPATILLILKATSYGSAWQIVSVCIYGASLMILYLASTLYHASKNERKRRRLNIFDHASIYLLIAGTYTPFVLVTLRGPWGWSLFGVVWAAAIGGIVFKLYFTGRFEMVSTIAYVLMGLVVLVAIKPLVERLPLPGFYWLIAGGVSYIVGAVFYMQRKMQFQHALFHILVLVGSLCHYWAIYEYVIS
ncbi:MAG: hemolysin III family protein [Bacteroidales bacterium]|nr:hemolysin III family protein [Bacteroidales bacterium]